MKTRKKLSDIRSALFFANDRAFYNTNPSESTAQNAMDYVDLYKFLYRAMKDKRYVADNTTDPLKNFDYRLAIADVHDELTTKVAEAKKIIRFYYRALEAEVDPDDEAVMDMTLKIMLDALLNSVRILYNRLIFLKKIAIDSGKTVPDLPKGTLGDISDVFRTYPSDFVNMEMDFDAIFSGTNFQNKILDETLPDIEMR